MKTNTLLDPLKVNSFVTGTNRQQVLAACTEDASGCGLTWMGCPTKDCREEKDNDDDDKEEK